MTLLALAALGAGVTVGAESSATVVERALQEVAAADRAADARWCACRTADELRALQSVTRAKVFEAMGPLPEKCPLGAVTVARVARDGYAIEKVMFASEPNHHVTAHLFLPDPKNFPGRRAGVVIPCGHSQNGKAEPSYQRAALMAAKRGIVALVYDPLDQGERLQHPQAWGTGAHNEIGRRAELLGWSMVRFRVRDGVRALDFLAARPEVDPERLGVMGHSGGGTMTAWLMALDDRVRSAAPSGFLSTQRAVCEAIGPQDAEQYVFGSLAFGFNHLGHILLRAPSPVLMCSSEDDFFPIAGSKETAARAQKVYDLLGDSDAFGFSHVLGPHHWHESTRTSAVDWMDRTLQAADLAFRPMEEYRKLDIGLDEHAVDTGLSDWNGDIGLLRTRIWPASVTPKGQVTALSGERTGRFSATTERRCRSRCPDRVRRSFTSPTARGRRTSRVGA